LRISGVTQSLMGRWGMGCSPSAAAAQLLPASHWPHEGVIGAEETVIVWLDPLEKDRIDGCG